MRRFLKGSLITGIVLLGMGLILCVTGLAIGTGYQDFRNLAVRWDNMFWSGHYYSSATVSEEWGYAMEEADWGYDSEWETSSSYAIADEQVSASNIPLDDVDAIKIDVASETVTIQPYEGDKIRASYNISESTADVYTEDGVLYITGSGSWDYNYVDVMVPADYQFDSIDIAAGSGSITLETLQAKKVTADISSGSLYINYMNCDEVDIEIGSGFATLDGVEIDDVSLSCGSGSIHFNGELTGDAELDCGSGFINMDLMGEEEDYNYEVKAGSKNVSFGDSYFGSVSRDRSVNNGGDSNIEIDCGSGSVSVSFEYY